MRGIGVADFPFLHFRKRIDISIAGWLLACCGYVRISQVMKDKLDNRFDQESKYQLLGWMLFIV